MEPPTLSSTGLPSSSASTSATTSTSQYTLIKPLTIPVYWGQAAVVPRSKLWSSNDHDDEHEGDGSEQDPELLEQLKRGIESTLEVPDAGGEATGNKKKRKRRKLNPTAQPILFRLVSNEPQLVSLNRPPPPPSVLKVLAPEDTPAEAEQRSQRAVESAVDGDWVIAQSRVPYARNSQQASITITATKSTTPDASLLVLQRTQPPRKTRPPVDPASLGYPYTSGISKALSAASSKTDIKCCAVMELPPPSSQSTPPTATSRRQRKYHRSRPPPAYWRPPAALKGKAQGYAYGYPSSYAAVDGWAESGVLFRRDKFKAIKLGEGGESGWKGSKVMALSTA